MSGNTAVAGHTEVIGHTAVIGNTLIETTQECRVTRNQNIKERIENMTKHHQIEVLRILNRCKKMKTVMAHLLIYLNSRIRLFNY